MQVYHLSHFSAQESRYKSVILDTLILFILHKYAMLSWKCFHLLERWCCFIFPLNPNFTIWFDGCKYWSYKYNGFVGPGFSLVSLLFLCFSSSAFEVADWFHYHYLGLLSHQSQVGLMSSANQLGDEPCSKFLSIFDVINIGLKEVLFNVIILQIETEHFEKETNK